MVGIHILKRRYNCSDDRAVEMLHENAYRQSFCGFNSFQRGQILDSTTLLKFRNQIGTEGMKRIEAILLQTWSDMGLVKTRRVAVDTTSQPKNIAYPTDADLLHRIKDPPRDQEVPPEEPRSEAESHREAQRDNRPRGQAGSRCGQHPLQPWSSGVRSSVGSPRCSGQADHLPDGRSAPRNESGQSFVLSAREGCGGLILSHQEYQQNVADVKTLGRAITG